MKPLHTCPYCDNKHRNQEFSPYCDIDCVMADRREYDKACKELDTQELEKQRDKLKFI